MKDDKRDAARSIVERANDLAADLIREYARDHRNCRPGDLSASAVSAIRGAVLDGADSALYAEQALRADGGRELSPDELALLQRAVRLGVALGAEIAREGQAARCRELGNRVTPSQAPKGSFSVHPPQRGALLPPAPAGRGARMPPPLPPRRDALPSAPSRAAPTVPVDTHDRVTAPARAPDRGSSTDDDDTVPGILGRKRR